MNPLRTNSLRSGDLIDHYRIEGLAASGGMASVFRATDTRTGRNVAVKIPNLDKIGDRKVLERFHRETQVARLFDHPGLVKTLPNDRANDQYAVMEWVEGRLLREIIHDEVTLPVGRAIRIMLGICNALEYVHERGFVHGDLKPDNVMVDAEDRIKVIDFGVARESRLSLWKRATFGTAMGTPDYASPEQLKGKYNDVRSDVYSLGIILFEILTGEVPFSGVDPHTAMQLRLAIDAPSPCEINPRIPSDLESIVKSALARRPADRCASVQELALNLSRFLGRQTSEQPLELLAQF
jgi:serine/threonine protein kinase